MKKALTLFMLFYSLAAHATHNRAGEITFKCLDETSHYYEITVTTYTRICQYCPDMCELEVYFGDGDSAVAHRINGIPSSACGNVDSSGVDLSLVTRKNIYKTWHHFVGPGTYHISMEDPNRNSGIINIPNSVNVPFHISSTLVINALLPGCNNSPVLTIPPLQNGCIGKCFYHNPGAYDPDGDSLSYSLALCLGANGQTVQSFSDPYYPSNVIVNPVTGDFVWCSPVNA